MFRKIVLNLCIRGFGILKMSIFCQIQDIFRGWGVNVTFLDFFSPNYEGTSLFNTLERTVSGNGRKDLKLY